VKAGFGTAVITPALPVHLAGFGGRTEPANAVHDELEARAVVFEDGTERMCLISCDLLGMSPSYAYPLREAISEATGLAMSQIVVSCTHTHQGPSVMSGTDALGWPNPPDYEDVLRAGCAAAVEAAIASLVEATFAYQRSPLPDGFAFNRRGGDFAQPWFATLDVHNGDGTRIGLVANMHIHPVLLGPHWDKVATDWVGPFRRELEATLGGTAIQLTGALGDINPTPPAAVDDTYEVWASADETAEYGRRLAATVIESLGHGVPGAGLSLVRHETKEIAVGMTPIAALQGEPTMKVEFIEWDVAGVRLVSIPGEGFHLLGKQIASARGDRVLLAGIAPAWHGYLPVPWGAGYEEGVSFGEEFVAAVCDELRRA
jgi:hypothetical protein